MVINKTHTYSHFKSLYTKNTTIYVNGNQGPDVGRAQNCDILNG